MALWAQIALGIIAGVGGLALLATILVGVGDAIEAVGLPNTAGFGTSAKCDHCGRYGVVKRTWEPPDMRNHTDWRYLCSYLPDGRTADPDCFFLVSTGREQLGARLPR